MLEIVQVANIPDLLHSIKSNTPHPEYSLPRTSYQSQKLQNSVESNTLTPLFYSFSVTRDKIEQDKIITKLIKLIMWTRKPEKQKQPNGTKSLQKKIPQQQLILFYSSGATKSDHRYCSKRRMLCLCTPLSPADPKC